MLCRTWFRLSVLARAAAILEATFRVLVDIRRSDPESSSIDVEIWRLECDQSDTLEILANVDFCWLLVEVEYRNAFGDWISRV